jgi:hypothetical protein
MSTEEKRNLGAALTRLSADDLRGALEIVAQTNPNFQANADEVDLDMDAQVRYILHSKCHNTNKPVVTWIVLLMFVSN